MLVALLVLVHQNLVLVNVNLAENLALVEIFLIINKNMQNSGFFKISPTFQSARKTLYLPLNFS